MIFCSKPFKHAFKTTRILSEIHIAPNFRSKAYGLTKNNFRSNFGSDRPLELQIFVRHMIFIIPKDHSYYPENFRSEAYGLNESNVLVKL